MITFKNILVGVDTSQPTTLIVERAVQIAQAHGAALTLVDGLPRLNWAQRLAWNDSQHVQDLLLAEKTGKLKKLVASLRKRGFSAKYRVLMGRTSEELVRQVLRGKHDLLIRAAKGHLSARGGTFGSTAYELLRKCPCPVWLIPADQEGPIARVLAAVDTNPERACHAELDQRILATALDIARVMEARVDVMHAWSVYGEKIVRDYMKSDEFEQLQSTLRAEHGGCLDALVQQSGFTGGVERVHLVRGDAKVEIPKFAKENQIDLLVMGTLARTGVAGVFLGNTLEMVLNQVQCSVLALKPQGFVSPIRKRPPLAEPLPVDHLPKVLPQPPIP